jgi:D-arabinose 1-dehydrogenase-like Zn-dependent alcohol dehydrogenase
LGGARVILAMAPNAKAMAEMVGGLRAGRKLLCIGVPAEPMEVALGPLTMGKRDIQGWPSGTAIDSEDTLRFAGLTGVKAMVENYPLEKVKEAYERMLSGKAEFWVVLTISNLRNPGSAPSLFGGTQGKGTAAEFSLRAGRQLRKDDK